MNYQHQVVSKADTEHVSTLLALEVANEKQRTMLTTLLDSPGRSPGELKEAIGANYLSDIARRLNRKLLPAGYGVSCESPPSFRAQGNAGYRWNLYRVEQQAESVRDRLRRQLSALNQ